MILRIAAATAAFLTMAWAPSAMAQRVIRGDCSLSVDGKTYINIKRTCRISLDRDGSFSINTLGNGERVPRRYYFAFLDVNPDGSGSATWNDSPGALHAQTRLGDGFRRKGGCWSNRRATICAYAPRR